MKNLSTCPRTVISMAAAAGNVARYIDVMVVSVCLDLGCTGFRDVSLSTCGEILEFHIFFLVEEYFECLNGQEKTR